MSNHTSMPDTPATMVDLLVVGGGAAGLSTALFAALEGLSVLICEKSDQIGGTSATSAGTVWIPGSKQAERAGLGDSANAAQQFLDVEVRGFGSAHLRRAYLETGPEAIERLERETEVKFAAAAQHPDYHDGPGSAVGGRALTPLPFDGRMLGKDFDHLRPPIPEFMLLGGMMVGKNDIAHLIKRYRSWSSFWHSAGLVARYALDILRYRRGTRLVMGNALVARLLYSLRKQENVEIRLGAPVLELLTRNGRIVGGIIDDGKRRIVRARRGVVLASGGFPQSRRWRDELMPALLAQQRSLGFVGNVGDGATLAFAVGGTIERDHAVEAFLMPVSLTRRNDGSEGQFPHIYLDRAKPGVIAVNRAGRRFVNEADSYHDFVLAMFRDGNATPAHLICGDEFIAKYGIGLVPPGTRNVAPYVKAGHLVGGGSLVELAARIGVPPQELTETVERYNKSAQAGTDEEFGRGSTEMNRFNGDPEHRPNPCVGPVIGPRYYAMALWPSDIGTSVGLRTNEDGSVLDATGAAIAGLYAVGSDMSSIMRGCYPGPGITLGPAITFGYRAAMHAAGRPIPIGKNLAR
jgi:succinate dehydrogenase/fumarate reductase flavoprotein subunit